MKKRPPLTDAAGEVRELTADDMAGFKPAKDALPTELYAGLVAIARYHASRGEANRKICLIPKSAHGTRERPRLADARRRAAGGQGAEVAGAGVEVQGVAQRVGQEVAGHARCSSAATYPSTAAA